MVENIQSECDDDPLMGNNQYDRYYLDDDWYQDIKLDASIPISSGEDLISSTSFHTNNKDKSSTPFNNLSSNSPKNQNNGNIISNQKCLFDKNKDSADANLKLFIGDDNDNPASYLTNKSYETEVRIFALCLTLYSMFIVSCYILIQKNDLLIIYHCRTMINIVKIILANLTIHIITITIAKESRHQSNIR